MYSYPRLSRANRTTGTGYLRFCVRAGAADFLGAVLRRAVFAARAERFGVGAVLRRGTAGEAATRGPGAAAACVRPATGVGDASVTSRVRCTSVNRTSSPTAW